MTGGRPRRPAEEARLVRAAAGDDPRAPREPLARTLAAAVVGHLRDHAAEAIDPLQAALGEVRRAMFPSPALSLATDPTIDTLSLFVEARTASLRDRNGWPRSTDQEWKDVEAAFQAVETKLAARYLKYLRA